MRLILIFLVAVFFHPVHSQDPFFTQIYANRLYLNPALTGIESKPLVHAQYRNQWPSLFANFVTANLAYDQKIEALNSGIGLIAMHDMLARNAITNSLFGLNYAYHLKINESFRLSYGAQFALGSKRVDWNQLTFGDMIDPNLGYIYQTGDMQYGNSRQYLDISTGLAVQFKGLFLGCAAHHLNTPNVSLLVGNSPLPMRFGLHGGYNFRFNLISGEDAKILTVTPNFFYQFQNGFDMLVGGAYMNFANFTFGAFGRSNDALLGILGYDFKFGRVSYSYDYTTSQLTNATGGSHELSLSWRFGVNRQTQLTREHEFPQF
jgi:type IX secretion system PorP/SprF family membrane protein